MFHWNMQPYGLNVGSIGWMAQWLIPLYLWALVWKGLTLWVAARRGHVGWFVLFLILNTAGIAEIIYLLVTGGFDELKDKKSHTNKS